MNDIEDLVRAEMRARVAAAERAAADQRPGGESATLLRDLARRIRRARIRRRLTASAMSAVAFAAAVTLPLALLSSGRAARPGPVKPGAVPPTDTATPRGWARLANGDAQISAPSDWRVSTRVVCDRTVSGYVVLGNASTSLIVRNPRCRQAPNMAAILLEPRNRSHPVGSTDVINGIPVVRVPAQPGFLSYVVPTLHVLVAARGPLASRVLATLARSPLSVVLASGPEFPVPPHWRWHHFGGIRFAAPASWRVERSTIWGNCRGAYSMNPRTVQLSTARKVSGLRCALTPDVMGPGTLHQGVIVGAGRAARMDSSRFDGCRKLHGVRACYSASIYQEGLLDVAVFVHGRHQPTVVQIGLAGNGVTARTIFGSIGPP